MSPEDANFIENITVLLNRQITPSPEELIRAKGILEPHIKILTDRAYKCMGGIIEPDLLPDWLRANLTACVLVNEKLTHVIESVQFHIMKSK